MSRQSVTCPNCATQCEPDAGIACASCGAFLSASPLIGSARPTPTIGTVGVDGLIGSEADSPTDATPGTDDDDAGPDAEADTERVIDFDAASFPRHRWPWRRVPGDDLLPDAELRRRRWRRIGGGLMIIVSLGTTAWWQSLDRELEAPAAVVGDGTPTVGDGSAAVDRPTGRPIGSGAETVLAEVYRPAAALYADWGTWDQVTPEAIGESASGIGLLGSDVAPERADEISVSIGARGVLFGTLDLGDDGTDCVWLRDAGLGPHVLHDTGEGDCSADNAPARGWEPVAID